MNKRIRKKHKWLGVKRAGANHCANEIAQHIGRKILYSGITPKPSYRLNVRRHIRWFFHHSSEEEWTKRAGEAYYPHQMFLSAKHLLPVDYDCFGGRYGPNPPLKDMLEDLIRKTKRGGISMSKEFKLVIWWPLRLLPDEIDLALKSELIQTLLERKSLRCRMYENEEGSDILRMTHVDPHKPHLYISNIEKDAVLPGYTATCKIPDVYGWEEIFKSFTQPVVYPVLIKTTDKSFGQNKFVICHFKLVEYDKVDKLGSSYGGVNYPFPERWTYPENTHLTYIDGPEKSLAQRLQEEYDERRKKLINKIKNGDTRFNNIGEDGGPTMDYRIQSYNDYGAHGPIEPLVLEDE